MPEDERHNFYRLLQQSTEETIRVKGGMQWLVLPDIELKHIQVPRLGQFKYGNRSEHMVEKWMRVHCLLRYASSRFAKSSWTTPNFLDGNLRLLELEQMELTDQMARYLLKREAEQWLGLNLDWTKLHPDLDRRPAWMSPVKIVTLTMRRRSSTRPGVK